MISLIMGLGLFIVGLIGFFIIVGIITSIAEAQSFKDFIGILAWIGFIVGLVLEIGKHF